MSTDTINDAVTMQPGGGAALGRIDQYELVRELGGGGFGTVYLARDTVSGIEVAVKGLPPLVRSNREELENVRSNFALVSRLSHTNIAKALVLHPAKEVSYASEDVRQKLRVLSGDFLMVMEYAPGVTLSQWRRQFPGNKVPLGQALDIVRQVASAIDYAHERRIVHRDIKPANVMMETTADGRTVARILDFGLAAEIRSSMGRMSREIRDTSGTRPYMAPEQWLGGKQGPATDQYALAVLFHELITGEVPFSAVFETGDPVVMMNVVGREPFAPPDGLAKPVRLALAKALAKNPEERFASCAEFVAALEGKAKVSRGGAGTRRVGNLGKALGVFALLAALGAGGYYGWTKYDEGVRAREAENARIAAERAAEVARVRQEVYELKGRAGQVREKNAEAEWRGWPHFDVRARDLETAFRAGEFAFEKDDYHAARAQYLKVRDSWLWMTSNAPLRVRAILLRKLAEGECAKAAQTEPFRWSADGWVRATNRMAVAAASFDAGDFAGAVSGLDGLDALFSRVSRDAVAARKSDETRRLREATARFVALCDEMRHDEATKLLPSIDQSGAEVAYYMGFLYENGLGGLPIDVHRAAELYGKSAAGGFARAQFTMGRLLYDGAYNLGKDRKRAMEFYRQAAEQRNADAQLRLAIIACDDRGGEALLSLGRMLNHGMGVATNQVLASKYTAKDMATLIDAADHGSAYAQCKLGDMTSGEQAFKWYESAAKRGFPRAQWKLASAYERGNGTDKDVVKALDLFGKAAEGGLQDAQYHLAQIYEGSVGNVLKDAYARNGVGIDGKKMVHWYEKAAEQGHVWAQYGLGLAYVKGDVVKEDSGLALKWLRQSAKNGKPCTLYVATKIYREVPPGALTGPEVVSWYRKAVENGDESWLAAIGIIYDEGRFGIAPDPKAARECYQRQVDGFMGGKGEKYRVRHLACKLAEMYERGRGGEVDMEKAGELYRIAKELGDRNALEGLDRVEHRGVPPPLWATASEGIADLIFVEWAAVGDAEAYEVSRAVCQRGDWLPHDAEFKVVSRQKSCFYYDHDVTATNAYHYWIRAITPRGYGIAAKTSGQLCNNANLFTLHYDANGGSGKMLPEKRPRKQARTLTRHHFSRPGYAFAGWAKTPSGKVFASNGSNASPSYGTDAPDVTIYAAWEKADDDGFVIRDGSLIGWNGEGPADVVIPDGVQKIGHYAFCGSAVASVRFPDSLFTIGAYAFHDCWSLTNVTFGSSALNVDDYAFIGCKNLKGMVEIAEGVESLSRYSFCGVGMDSVALPASLRYLHWEAFSGCNNLTSIWFRGNAPKVPHSGRGFETRDDCVIYVPKGSTGWKDSTTALPDRWPAAINEKGESHAIRNYDLADFDKRLARSVKNEFGRPFCVFLDSGTKVAMRWCPPGRFTMGSPSSENGRQVASDGYELQCDVSLNKGFWIGETEILQAQWEEVMGTTVVDMARKALHDENLYEYDGQRRKMRDHYGMSADANPEGRCGDRLGWYPMYNVSWHDATEFCRRLTKIERENGRQLPDGYEYRLPTEAEWEYACRAGTKTALPNGSAICILGLNNAPALDAIAWYSGNSSEGMASDARAVDTSGWREKQYPGGRAFVRAPRMKQANGWGLYDMLGNVLEWCADGYSKCPRGGADPIVAVDGPGRTLRGGSWFNVASVCRPAARIKMDAGVRMWHVGFRVVLAPKATSLNSRRPLSGKIVRKWREGRYEEEYQNGKRVRIWVPGSYVDEIEVEN